MNCLIYNCEETADYPYLACGINHGLKLKQIKQDLKDYQDGVSLSNWFPPNGPGFLSINEIEYYVQLN